MALNFKKNKENFECGNCGTLVVGNGYTNHCPQCLWSKHVDVTPGDRMSVCGGMMRPVAMGQKKGEFIIIHQCIECGYEKRNKISEADDFEEVIKIIKI